MPIDLFESPTLDRRRYCECCGYPTLVVPNDPAGRPEWASSSTACDLCEWDSAPLSSRGEPLDSANEDRNDGLPLSVARAHYARHGSIYDPADPPLWKVSPPSADVRNARSWLRVAYRVLLAAPERERWARWLAVTEAERSLRDALVAQQAQDEELAGGGA